MTSPIGIGSSVIETERMPRRGGIVKEIFTDEKGNFHACVIKDNSDDYFWSPVQLLHERVPRSFKE